MKTNLITFLIFFSFSSLLNCQIKNLPKNFPKDLLNKVFCGSDEGFSEYKSGFGSHGYSNYKVDWKVTISESEGLFVEYDYNALFEKKWGRTQSVVDFSLYEVKEIEDRYGDITEYIWNYRLKTPFTDDTKQTSYSHSIRELQISQYANSKEPYGMLRIKISNSGRDDLSIYLGSGSQRQCGVIKSLAEIKLEKEIKEKKEKEAQILIQEQENSDKLKFEDIKKLIDNNQIEDAIIETNKLNFPVNFPYWEELNIKIDLILINEINVQLNNFNFDMVIKLYESIRKDDNKKKQNEIIKSKLQSYYLNKIDSIHSDVYSSIFQENKLLIKDIKPGYHKLKIDLLGNVFLDDKIISKTRKITEKKFGEFSIQVVSQKTLNFTAEYLPIGPKLYLKNPKTGSIYQNINNNKKYCDNLGLNITSKNYTIINSVFEFNSIPKKTLRTIQPTDKYLVIDKNIKILTQNENEIIIESNDKKQKISFGNGNFIDEKLKHHWKVKAAYAGYTIIYGGLGSIGFWYYSNLLQQEKKNNLENND